jgi:hypothetical protein
MCSFSQLFFGINQLRIGTKSAFEFHNHRSVHISVILSNLNFFLNIIGNYVMCTALTLAISINIYQFFFMFYKYLISILFLFFTTKKIIKFVFSHYFDYDDRLFLEIYFNMFDLSLSGSRIETTHNRITRFILTPGQMYS